VLSRFLTSSGIVQAAGLLEKKAIRVGRKKMRQVNSCGIFCNIAQSYLQIEQRTPRLVTAVKMLYYKVGRYMERIFLM
jgi:hypothetical protein